MFVTFIAVSVLYSYALHTDSLDLHPIKVTLTWTDYPASATAARALVNDLDLSVVEPLNATVYWGKSDGGLISWSCQTPQCDIFWV